MREINEIIVHCTATPEGRHVDVPTVDYWHKQRGFKRAWRGQTYHFGYHFLIGLDGERWTGRPLEIPGAHVRGRNTGTIGVSYVGGVDAQGRPKDTRTPAQKQALVELLQELLHRFPSVTKISGHRDYAAKACPSFDATSEYAGLSGKAPVKPAFQNPMADEEVDTEPETGPVAAIKILEEANFLQKQGRDCLDKAAALHWKGLEALRSPTNEA